MMVLKVSIFLHLDISDGKVTLYNRPSLKNGKFIVNKTHVYGVLTVNKEMPYE